MCCFTWLIFEQDPRIAGRSGSPVAPGLCHFNRKERKIRELTQNELNTVSGGKWSCGFSIAYPVSIGFGCSGDKEDWEALWDDILEWWNN